MKARQIRRYEQRLRDLDITIPVPFDARTFCAHIAERRGRPIHVLSLDTSAAAAPCGLWLATDKADYIAVDEKAPPVLRSHILLHELAHMLCDHTGRLELDTATPAFTILDPEMVKRVLGRTSRYPDEQEREAEGLASVFIRFAAQRSPVPRPRGSDDSATAELDRVSAALAADRSWK
ncbi:hypothetical protein Asp14428_77270 [Actinoplanes sp. NBRC 14428]|uniref:IrrE N-terminal-like domain-containing protein n=1 Tax=Pseudosporangium ferrugineum TaxID=439699 RepID=A0A2T0RWY8_9ACTN|nr:hypothetical protein [Pseudosporangium ferrugineum]PRY25705.1 hypothetical protein CLV70_11271 [Pseudosporangium ferrugineum]BCJ56252.1 hypothetical protein Asp14428_77270 [Actinoplanes sp. NBRC 14428]